MFVFSDGIKVAVAKPVNLADNARVKKEKSLSLASMLGEGDRV